MSALQGAGRGSYGQRKATKVTVKVRNQADKAIGILKHPEDNLKSTTRLADTPGEEGT